MSNDPLLYDAGKLYAEMIYPTLSEDDLTLISFGMTNKPIADAAEEYFKKLYLEKVAAHYECSVAFIEKSVIQSELRRQTAEFMRGVSVGLMEQRKKEGMMVC